MYKYHYILPLSGLLLLVGASCGGASDTTEKDSYVIAFDSFEEDDESVEPVEVKSGAPSAGDVAVDAPGDSSKVEPVAVNADSAGKADADSSPASQFVKLRLNPIGGSLGRVFNDSNHVHLAVAEEIGVSPIESLSDAWHIRRPVKKIVSCKEYFVDELTHSLPYLVPEAYDLLKEIGTRFNDTLQARGGGDYRIKVTSVLRTSTGIKKLRRRNINAVKNSTHQFGTTFDISYAKFISGPSTTVGRTQEDLKNLLAEILKELVAEGKCYVKYERKQSCFHITARPVGNSKES